MKKHFTPYMIALVIILAISAITLGVTLRTRVGNPEPASIYFLDLGLGGGKCVRVVYEDDGTPIGSSSYTGVWNGSYDCVRAITAQPTTTTPVSTTGSGLNTMITPSGKPIIELQAMSSTTPIITPTPKTR